jgi:hypothetical protein
MSKLLVTFLLLAMICLQTVNYAKDDPADSPVDDGVVVEDDVELDSDGLTDEQRKILET